MIDGHGDDLFLYGDKIKVNFSTNIPQSVDHTGLLKHLVDCGDIFRNYPEPAPRSVEQQLADKYGVTTDNVIVTNGATEAIYLLAHAYRDGTSGIIIPTFREYQDACRIFLHNLEFITALSEVNRDMQMVWLCNPNNPTGRIFDRTELLATSDRFKDILFVVDQAYADYSVSEVLTVDDVIKRNNMVMLRSLTKQFTIPGLRIGYAIGSTCIINRLRALRMPWSVNSIAIQAAHYLLEHSESYKIDASILHSEAIRIAKAMTAMGIKTETTDCNFILGCLPDSTASELKQWLIDRHGLLIRDASNFEGLSPRHFRVAAQSYEENNLLISALKEWISLS
ncbi:MAG: aminotransferase class I/II-fold pyridoxal phosphate-dependent enzyme [Muribaculaceae bacterium]|nr:aminotransferase class I/II-fold pyridoxal phosphate-dependent enzyme [Muribaculaceae bacterium]